MAEAHQAVSFSSTITHEGRSIDYDQEVFHLIWKSGIRSWKKRTARFVNNVRNRAYPTHLQSLWIVITIAVALHLSGRKSPFDLSNRVIQWLPGQTILWHLVACTLAGFAFWLCICLAMRYATKMLLTYKGWMYESRAKGSRVSLTTRLWAIAIKFLLSLNKPRLYSFQKSFPRLQVPIVNETLARYLDTVHPLLNDDKFKRMQDLANDFERTIAPKLQRYLILKSLWSTNYVTDWWEEYVYLRGRSSLMINSNYYGVDVLSKIETNRQSARAAVAVNLIIKFRDWIERQELEPIMFQKLVPLCSWQYERMFNTVRVPGIETDRLIHYHESNHIVVMYKGRFFKMIIEYNGRPLNAPEIQVQLDEILSSKWESFQGEERLASLTAWNRTKWAKVRNVHFNKGINAISLHTIESAAFILCLDDEPYETNADTALDHFGKSMLHGSGKNRWFDKSFMVCVGTNGRIGFNSEHTWADATVMGHLWENTLMDEIIEKPYDKDGNCKGTIELQLPSPQHLSWDLNNEECLSKINEAYEDALTLINDLQLRIYCHDNYGKGFMKKCCLSPDAYVQMALQLAYYRDAGHFSLTYEASMTRLFLEGRTETVRPCSIESAAWVKAMENTKSTSEHRISLLRKACQRHQRGYQDAMCGKGVDRHLFCLYVVSKYLDLDSPFLNEVLSEPWRLSTSQTPQGQTSKLDLNAHPDSYSAGGGFGPVTDDGYGVSYMIVGEDRIFFHISSKAICPTTDAVKFSKQIERAMTDMKNLFE